MQSYQHGNETLFFEDGVSLAEMEAAARRIDAQRAARDRTLKAQNTIEQIKLYLANTEAQVARDAATMREAYDDQVEGHRRYLEVRHEERQLEAEEAAQRAAEAALVAEKERPRSWLEQANDRNRAKAPKEDFEQ